jgi:hypothetical protein
MVLGSKIYQNGFPGFREPVFSSWRCSWRGFLFDLAVSFNSSCQLVGCELQSILDKSVVHNGLKRSILRH